MLLQSNWRSRSSMLLLSNKSVVFCLNTLWWSPRWWVWPGHREESRCHLSTTSPAPVSRRRQNVFILVLWRLSASSAWLRLSLHLVVCFAQRQFIESRLSRTQPVFQNGGIKRLVVVCFTYVLFFYCTLYRRLSSVGMDMINVFPEDFLIFQLY